MIREELDSRLPLFSSARERRLWLWTLAVVAAIYATLGLARRLAGVLADRGLISDVIWVGLFLVGAGVVAQGLKARPRGVEIGVALGVAGAYLIAFMRMTLPEERGHLIEYTVVALLMYEALTERASQGRRVRAPALMAIFGTTLAGAVDEGIQWLLPSRGFEFFDILFDFLAAVMAVGGCAVLRWVRGWKKQA